jgi:hypothetical protein
MEWLQGLLRRTKGDTGSRRATFDLSYGSPGGDRVLVGRLHFGGTEWTFAYSPDFQQRSDLRPLEGFDDKHHVYRSRALFPFFAVRIPDEDRSDVKRTLAAEGIERPSPADMLRLFGRKNVASPAYELTSPDSA